MRTQDPHHLSNAKILMGVSAALAVLIAVAASSDGSWMFLLIGELACACLLGVALAEHRGWLSHRRAQRMRRLIADSAPGSITWTPDRWSAWFLVACHYGLGSLLVLIAATERTSGYLLAAAGWLALGYPFVLNAVNRYTFHVSGSSAVLRFYPLPSLKPRRVVVLDAPYHAIARCEIGPRGTHWYNLTLEPIENSPLAPPLAPSFPVGQADSLEEAEMISARMSELLAASAA